MSEIKTGGFATSKKHPGLWTVVEVDGAMVRIRDSRGFQFLTTVHDLTPYSPDFSGLSANDIGVTTITWLTSLLNFNKADVYIAMEQAGYRQTQLFTDLMAVALNGVLEGGGDLPTVLQDALFAVAKKRNDLQAKEMAEALLKF